MQKYKKYQSLIDQYRDRTKLEFMGYIEIFAKLEGVALYWIECEDDDRIHFIKENHKTIRWIKEI